MSDTEEIADREVEEEQVEEEQEEQQQQQEEDEYLDDTVVVFVREKTAKVMFETFEVPYTFLASQVVLSLYGAGLGNLTGVVVNIGEGTTDIVPYYEGRGQHLAHAAMHHEISGRDMTDYMMMLLAREKNYQFFTRAERELIRDMKDHLSYIPLSYEDELERMKYAHASFYEQSYQLPNHQFIEVGKERYLVPEILFKPYMADSKVRIIWLLDCLVVDS